MDFIREAELILLANEIKETLRHLRENLLKDVALTAKSMYDELLTVGMTEEQAFEITKTYIIEFTRMEYQEVEAGVCEDDEYWDDE